MAFGIRLVFDVAVGTGGNLIIAAVVALAAVGVVVGTGGI
jgi:hypothetical protein